jgi:hypothetical protein
VPESQAMTLPLRPSVRANLMVWIKNRRGLFCVLTLNGQVRVNGFLLLLRRSKQMSVALSASKAARIVEESENSPGGAQLRCT